MSAHTYAEHAAQVEPFAAELERIAHRLRQGAISDESAAAKLTELAGRIYHEPVKTATVTKRERSVNSFTAHRNWQGGVSYEWVTLFYRDGELVTQAVSRTRKEARERIAELGYTEVSS